MFSGLASILFPTLTCKASVHSPFNPLHVYVNNASDMDFHLSVALGNVIDMARLTFL